MPFFRYEKIGKGVWHGYDEKTAQVSWLGVHRREVELIKDIVDTFGGTSRRELAHTVCELLDWNRTGDGLKTRE